MNAARESSAKPEDVEKIFVAGPQSGLVADIPPADVIQAIHSLSYYIASAVADKDFSWAHAEPAMIERPVIRRLIGLVAQDPTPPSVRYQWPWGATVTIVTKTGARFSSTVDAPKGAIIMEGLRAGSNSSKCNSATPASLHPAST